MAATETHGALNADAFVPAVAPANTTANFYVTLNQGSVFPGTIGNGYEVFAPTTIDPNGLDVGREITLQLTPATSSVAYTWDPIYLFTNGAAPALLTTGQSQGIEFWWNGANWIEEWRTHVTAVSCAAGTVNLTTEVITNGMVTHC